ncbi:MAG: ParB/RepB/Spo0J family partition protein [Vicinamibacteria bacterium]|nr:ParB/RepB/Spo0J family partition protein [Vicinamibacteria bacterium]
MSSARRIGLPDAKRMRHDLHFVDQLTRPNGHPIGRLLPIEDIDPNPTQPRQGFGDLTELTESIREKGVIEPIIVRPIGSRYQIIAGERRYRAAVDASLAEIPCVIRSSSDAEVMELALVENLQRKDLEPFEEADGLKALADRFGYTHEMIAEKIGKSRTSITETLAISGMPDEVRELCRLADIRTKSLLLQVVRQKSPQEMIALVEQLQQGPLTREKARHIKKQIKGVTRGRPKNYVFHFQPQEKSFRLSVHFRKSEVERGEIIRILQSVIDNLSQEKLEE